MHGILSPLFFDHLQSIFMSTLTNSPAWLNLQNHYKEANQWHMRDLFAQDDKRAARYTIETANLHLDYSKNIINDQTLTYLVDLLEQQSFTTWRDKLFAGDKINHTEDRSVLHTALRQSSESEIRVDGENIVPSVRDTLASMQKFTEAVHQQKHLGYTGKPIDTIVNIGIGGSDLGPKMIVNALKDYAEKGLQFHYVSNIDPSEISDILEQCKAETTLFIIVSKTFTTIETLHNADVAKQWLLENGLKGQNLQQHFAAVSTNVEAAQAFGVNADAIFPMDDWVGGRFSLWSAVGLSIMLAVGADNFAALLAGADEMDTHFKQAEPAKNMPVIMALLGVWYNNFFNAQTVAVLPYSRRLAYLPSYLQQVDMESNGKSIDRDGAAVDYQTGTIVWGEPGTNGQHAFYQLIHQGTKLIPCDFIAMKNTHSGLDKLQSLLNANCIAQMEALMLGKSIDEAKTPYQSFAGNKPSNAILMQDLTPKSLGALIALYEHKVFVQGVIWNVNSYDQWGVEYGKQLAKTVYQDMQPDNPQPSEHDASTRKLIKQLS